MKELKAIYERKDKLSVNMWKDAGSYWVYKAVQSKTTKDGFYEQNNQRYSFGANDMLKFQEIVSLLLFFVFGIFLFFGIHF